MNNLTVDDMDAISLKMKDFIFKYDFCHYNEKGKCRMQQLYTGPADSIGNPTGCCFGCIYDSSNGCTMAIKNVICSLFYCGIARAELESIPEAKAEFDNIREIFYTKINSKFRSEQFNWLMDLASIPNKEVVSQYLQLEQENS